MIRGTGRRNIFSGSSSRHPNSSQYVDNDAETQDFPDREIPSGLRTFVRRRGRAKGIPLPSNGDEKIKVKFDQNGYPVGKNSKAFITKIGTFIKDQEHFPYWQPRYNDFSLSKFEELERIIESYFILEYAGDIPTFLKEFCKKTWNNARSNLYRNHYMPHGSHEEALRCPPRGIDEDDWMKICNIFDDERWPKASERNKANRARQRVAHIAGRMSFAQRREHLKGVLERSPEKRECWNFNHVKETNEYPNEFTEHVTRRLNEMVDTGVVDQNRVFQEILGPQRKGRIHGEGRSVRTRYSGATCGDTIIEKKMEELKTENAQILEENNRILEENKQLKVKFNELTETVVSLTQTIQSGHRYLPQFTTPSTTQMPAPQLSFQHLLQFGEQSFGQQLFGQQLFGQQQLVQPVLGTHPPLQASTNPQHDHLVNLPTIL